MQNKFWIILSAAVVGLIAIFFIAGGKPSTPEELQYQEPILSIQTHDHTKGEGKNVLIEYGDFQCPSCLQWYSLIDQVVKELAEDLTFVFRHFPLRTIHPNAQSAHLAAEAAAKQDKFFEMYDLIYQTQNQWSSASNVSEIFESFAEQLELDMDQYKEDVRDSLTNTKINSDIKSGSEIGVTGTPSFFLNGEKVELQDAPTTVDGWQELLR